MTSYNTASSQHHEPSEWSLGLDSNVHKIPRQLAKRKAKAIYEKQNKKTRFLVGWLTMTLGSSIALGIWLLLFGLNERLEKFHGFRYKQRNIFRLPAFHMIYIWRVMFTLCIEGNSSSITLLFCLWNSFIKRMWCWVFWYRKLQSQEMFP